MNFDLKIFESNELESGFLEWLTGDQWHVVSRHFNRFWDYYTNRMEELGGQVGSYSSSSRYYVQSQERGLPARITGFAQRVSGFGAEASRVSDIERKEVVVENDIAWRINAGVDFLFGKPINFVCKSSVSGKSAEIEKILKAVFCANGGICFFQDMAVLGSVYGFVDCQVRPDDELLRGHISLSPTLPFSEVLRLSRRIDLELIEAPRALPILNENDYKDIRFYVQHFMQRKNSVSGGGKILGRLVGKGFDSRRSVEVTEITSSEAWQRYEDGELVGEGLIPWGELPVVHIQNIAQPYYYEGQSDVEQLIPLQDELNTRLSDRANRITFQSFKMYLGKGIEGFENSPVSPGRMWYTDNPDASIEEFGGDSGTPSEEVHISEIREALDKTSGVTPVVAGVLRNKVGNLSSAVAIRLTLMAMLSKTERKRFSYGEGIKKLCRLVLGVLDCAGIYKTSEDEREVELVFGSVLPENVMEKLEEAKIKKELGVSSEQVLKELGYEVSSKESL
jgi:hypothetical protein